MEIVQRITEDGEIYLANSMNSLRIEGQKTVGMEMVQQFDWQVPDWIIVPGGNLGNISALGKGLLEFLELGIIDRLPRLVCAQAERANPLYRSYLTDFEFNGIVEQATEQELADAAAQGDLTGLFNCPHTGVALAVLKKLVTRGQIRRGERVIVISTAHGLKFTDFKVKYHANELAEIRSHYDNQPIELAPDYDKVRDEIRRQIDKRFGDS
jgi:threonine synthase